MTSSISSDTKPRLRHCTLVDQGATQPLLVVVGTTYFELSEESGDRSTFLNIKRYFDGRHSIREISSITSVPEDEICDIVSQFADLGLMRRVNPGSSISSTDFVARILECCSMWSKQIGYHRIFGLLAEGKVRKEVFVGMLLENYHYVRSAPHHIGVAREHCSNPAWKAILEDFWNEEQGHEELYLQTLVRIGLKREEVEAAHPLIGTLSLTNMLCEIGRTSTLGYLCCTSLFEARGEDFEGAKNALESLGQNYGVTPEQLGPAIDHLRIDVAG